MLLTCFRQRDKGTVLSLRTKTIRRLLLLKKGVNSSTKQTLWRVVFEKRKVYRFIGNNWTATFWVSFIRKIFDSDYANFVSTRLEKFILRRALTLFNKH